MPCHDNSRLKRTMNGVVVQSTGAHDVVMCNVGVRIVCVHGADHVYADKKMGHDYKMFRMILPTTPANVTL
jgi:hypothetical protein